MNFLRRILCKSKKNKAWTYVVARTEQDAIKAVWLHGGLSGLDEAVQEALIHGGNVYCMCITVQHKVEITIVEDELDEPI